VEEITSYTEQEFSSGEIVWRQLIHPDDLANYSVEEEKLNTIPGYIADMQYRIYRKDGEMRWVHDIAHSTEYSDSTRLIQGAVYEITSFKLAEEALRESEAKFQSVFDQASAGIGILTLDGRWLQVNPMICSIVGYTPEELIGHPVSEITHPDDIIIDVKNIDELLSEAKHSIYLHKRYIHKNGSIVWVNIYSTLVRDSSSHPLYRIAVIGDVTEVRRAEEEKKQFYRDTISSVTDGKLTIADAEELKKYGTSADFTVSVLSFKDATDARQRVEDFCRSKGLSGEELSLFLTGFGEAVTNAVKHAGCGAVFAGSAGDTLWVGVSDKGTGMAALALPKATLKRGYSTKVSMGMGYSIMLDVSDRIMLNTGPSGTTVVLVKNLRKAEPVFSLENLPDTWDSIGAG
jgi:PAS domain S-box-containing protein